MSSVGLPASVRLVISGSCNMGNNQWNSWFGPYSHTPFLSALFWVLFSDDMWDPILMDPFMSLQIMVLAEALQTKKKPNSYLSSSENKPLTLPGWKGTSLPQPWPDDILKEWFHIGSSVLASVAGQVDI